MSDRPWHKRYHSDALSGYLALSLEERGAYTTLLDLMYDRGEALVENDRLLAGYLGVSVRKARSVIAALIAKRKIFRTTDGRLSNFRFEKERENELKTSRKHAENGSKGGRARVESAKKPNEINGTPQAGLEPASSLNQKPYTRDQIEEESISVVTLPKAPDPLPDPPPRQPFEVEEDQNRFREFWAAYPLKSGQDKAEAAFFAAAIQAPAEAIIAGAKSYAAARAGQDPRFTMQPVRWLQERRWRDEHAPPAAAVSPIASRYRAIAAKYQGSA